MSEEQDLDSTNEELIKAIEKAEKKAEETVKKSQDITQRGQYMVDLAGATKRFLREGPDIHLPKPERDRQLETWTHLSDRIDEINTGLSTSANTLSFLSSTGTAAASGILVDVAPVPDALKNIYEHGIMPLINVIEKEPWVQKAEEELKRHGLNNSAPDRKSALDLLRESHHAFQLNGSPAAVLLPIRESINTAISELLKRRPKQERTKTISAKILSIGGDCMKTGFNRSDLETIAKEAEDVIDKLSPAKQLHMDREIVRIHFSRACSFLAGFLEIIDKTKLRA
jgi:hypothetical protein